MTLNTSIHIKNLEEPIKQGPASVKGAETDSFGSEGFADLEAELFKLEAED